MALYSPTTNSKSNTVKNPLTLFLSLIAISLFAQREEKKIPATHTGSITSTAVNFDGSRALTGGTDARANLWNTITGAKVKGFGAQDKEITDVKLNSDETLFATSSRNMTIVVWDGVTQKPKKILKETSEVLALDFYPFNNNLISVDAAGAVKLWDGNSGKILNENYISIPEKQINTASVLYSHDGKHIGLHVNEKLYLYNYSDLKLLGTFDAAKNKISKQSFDISPDGKFLVYKNAANQLSLVNTVDGTLAQTLPGDFTHESFVSFANNSQLLFLGTDNGKVQIYNVAAKRVAKEFTAHEGVAVDGGLSLNGKVLITTGSDLSLKRWDVSDFAFNFCQEPEACSHNIAISSLMLNDENQNGLLDAGEKASMNVTVKNNDPEVMYDVIIKLNQNQPVEGLELPAEFFAGNLLASSTKTITIPVVTNNKLTQGSSEVTVDVTCMGAKMASKNITLQAGSSANAGLAVKSYKFYSSSGIAAKGEPITMVITLENITRIVAENVQIAYKFPQGVSAIEKTRESIPSFAANSLATISVQFIADKNISANEVTMGLDITGVAYSNAADLKMTLPLNQPIGTQQDMLAMLEKNTTEQMRGSLTISKADIPGVSIENSRYVALVIGIDNYTGYWNKLNNAVRDAKAVEDILKKNYNFSVVRSLYDAAATRQAIIGELEWLVANLKASDNLLIFYSGHGDFKESLNRGFWVPIDATTSSTSNFISNPDLQTFLGSIKAKHTLLVSDACFSGDIFRGSDRSETAEINDKYYNRVNSLASRQAITSGGIEPVMDGGKDGHSVFTYYMLKALKENTQKYIDATQLFDAIKIPVVNNSSQAPKFSHIKNTGDEGGEFVFFKK
jgi:WD40 repeat protein